MSDESKPTDVTSEEEPPDDDNMFSSVDNSEDDESGAYTDPTVEQGLRDRDWESRNDEPEDRRPSTTRVSAREGDQRREENMEDMRKTITADPWFWNFFSDARPSHRSQTVETDDSGQSGNTDAELPPYTQLDIPPDDLERDIEKMTLQGNTEIAQASSVQADLFAELTMKIAEDGFTPLIAMFLKIEQSAGHNLSADLEKDPIPFKEGALQILCSMEEEIIPEIAKGNICKAYLQSRESNGTLHLRLDENKQRGKGHPAIYVRSCVDDNGDSMLVSDAARVARYMLRYISEDSLIKQRMAKYCCQIDRTFLEDQEDWTIDESEAGNRRYLQTKASTRSETRVQTVKTFAQALRLRTSALDPVEARLEPPLQYCGYSDETDRRDSSHSKYGSSSSWLTGLFMAICRTLYKTTYRMRPFVVCLIGEERQGPIAEMILTRLSRAYYHTGGGFSIGLAGSSMRSILMSTLDARERAAAWRNHQDWLVKATPYEQNMDKEIVRMEVYMAKRTVERRKELKAQIDFYLTGFESASKRVTDLNDFYQANKDSPVWEQYPDLVQYIVERTAMVADGRKIVEQMLKEPLAEESGSEREEPPQREGSEEF